MAGDRAALHRRVLHFLSVPPHLQVVYEAKLHRGWKCWVEEDGTDRAQIKGEVVAWIKERIRGRIAIGAERVTSKE